MKFRYIAAATFPYFSQPCKGLILSTESSQACSMQQKK